MPAHPSRHIASRLGATLVVLGAAAATSTCKLADLVNPGRPAVLVVSPLSVADSAPVGSTARRVYSAALSGLDAAGAIPWTARVAQSSAWLRFTPLSGNTPDTVSLTLDPSGLAVGTYRDTLFFSISGGATAPLAVPVEFRIIGCRITDITPTIVLQDSLTAADCGAPGRTGRFGRLFGFSATSGDSISVRMFAPFDGFLVLDTVPGSTPLAQNDACTTGSTDPCLNYILLPRTGRYIVEATSASAGAMGLFRLDVLRPRPPLSPDTLRQVPP